jgi:hypothetical protein
MIKSNTAFLKQFTTGSIAFGTLLILGFIYALIHYSNRGFELSDETFYLFFSNYFNSESYTTSNFGLLNKAACFGNPSLINLRLAKLIYQALAVLFFIWSLLKYLNFKGIELNPTQKSLITIIIIITSFGHYDYLPMTLSYNSWSLILMLLCLGTIFIEFLSHSKIITLATSTFIGFICFSLFLTKLPNAIIALSVYWFFNLNYIKKNTLIKLGGFCLGLILAFLLILKNTNNLLALIENYRITIFEVKHSEADVYFKQFYKLIGLIGHHKLTSIIAITVLVLLTFIGLKIISSIKKNITSKKDIYSWAILIIGLLLWLPFYRGNGHKTYNDFIAVTLLILNPILFVYINSKATNSISQFLKNDLNIIILVLILMPVLLMLGTNNAFYYSVSPTMVFAFSGVLIYLIASKTNYATYLPALSLAICFFVLSIFYFGAVKKPYKQSNLNNKTFPLSFNPLLNGIYESRAAFIDYTSVNYIMDNFNQEHKPILTFFNFYGFTLINNCKMVTDLPLSEQERNLKLLDFLLSKVKELPPLILVPDTIIENKKFESVFAKHNIHLNQNYELVYKYKFLSNEENISFFKSTTIK